MSLLHVPHLKRINRYSMMSLLREVKREDCLLLVFLCLRCCQQNREKHNIYTLMHTHPQHSMHAHTRTHACANMSMLTSSSRSFRSLVVAASVNLDSPEQPRPAAGREKGRRKGEGRRRRGEGRRRRRGEGRRRIALHRCMHPTS